MYKAFDFDGVIANTGKTMAKILTNRFHVHIREEDLYVHHIEHQFQITKEEAKDIIDELCSYYRTINTYPSKNCEKVLYKLHYKTGEPITIVTARTDLDIVRKWLKYYIGDFFEVFSQDHGSKGEFLKEKGVDLFVEDHLLNAIDVANNGIIPVIFLRAWNRHCFTKRSMLNKIGHVVSDWDELSKILLD